MKQLHKRLTYANVMSSLAVFLVLGGASAVAASKISTKELKGGAVTTAKLKKNAVSTGKLRNSAVTNKKIRKNAVTGAKVNESSLGTVPDAHHLGGFPAAHYITRHTIVPFRVRLAYGQTVVIVSNGAVSLLGQCRENVSGNQDEVRMLGATSAPGAFMQGDTPHSGPGAGGASSFLEPTTLEKDRVLAGVVNSAAGAGKPIADDDIDTGFVAGPNGEYIGIDETTMFALDVGGSNCLIVGVAMIA